MTEENNVTNVGTMVDGDMSLVNSFLGGNLVNEDPDPIEEDIEEDVEDEVKDDGLGDDEVIIVSDDTDYEVKNKSNTDKDKQEVDASAENSESPHSPLAAILKEADVFTTLGIDEDKFNELSFEEQFDTYKKSQDSFIKASISTGIGDGIRAEITRLRTSSPEWDGVLSAMEKGIDPKEYFSVEQKVSSIESVSESALEDNEPKQKEIYREYLRKYTGFDESEIEDAIAAASETDQLEDKSKKALGKLKTHYKAEKARIEKEASDAAIIAQQEGARIIETIRTNLNSTEEIIPGSKLDDKYRERLLSLMVEPVGRDNSGRTLNAVSKKRMEDPLKFAMIEAAFVDAGFYDGDFSKVMKVAKTKSIKTLEEKLKGVSKSTHKSGKSTIVVDEDKKKSSDTAKSIGDVLNFINNR